MSEILTVQSYITFLESAASHQKWNYIQILTFLFHVRVYTNPQCGIRILCDVRTLQCTCWRFLLPLWRFLARFQTTPLCKDVRPEFAFAVFSVAALKTVFWAKGIWIKNYEPSYIFVRINVGQKCAALFKKIQIPEVFSGSILWSNTTVNGILQILVWSVSGS